MAADMDDCLVDRKIPMLNLSLGSGLKTCAQRSKFVKILKNPSLGRINSKGHYVVQSMSNICGRQKSFLEGNKGVKKQILTRCCPWEASSDTLSVMQ